MIHIRTSAIVGKEFRAREQVGAKETNVVGRGIWSLAMENHNLVLECMCLLEKKKKKKTKTWLQGVIIGLQHIQSLVSKPSLKSLSKKK